MSYAFVDHCTQMRIGLDQKAINELRTSRRTEIIISEDSNEYPFILRIRRNWRGGATPNGRRRTKHYYLEMPYETLDKIGRGQVTGTGWPSIMNLRVIYISREDIL